MAQHLGRQRVAKLMGAGRRGLDAGALERMPNDRSNCTRAQKSADGSFTAQKHTATSAAWASVAQVLRDRFADIRRKGKCGSLTAFPSDAHLSGIPVDIVKLEKGHFPSDATAALGAGQIARHRRHSVVRASRPCARNDP